MCSETDIATGEVITLSDKEARGKLLSTLLIIFIVLYSANVLYAVVKSWEGIFGQTSGYVVLTPHNIISPLPVWYWMGRCVLGVFMVGFLGLLWHWKRRGLLLFLISCLFEFALTVKVMSTRMEVYGDFKGAVVSASTLLIGPVVLWIVVGQRSRKFALR